jgi:hypothetical protein
MKKFILLTTIQCFYFITILGQAIPVGKYIGYENIFKERMTNGFYTPGVNIERKKDTTNFFHSNTWFHEVTINVISDTCVNISKVPVYFENGVKHYSDSIGGYIEYDCAKIRQFNEFAPIEIRGKYYISARVTKHKYCYKSATAIPAWAYCYYKIDFDNDGNLLLKGSLGVLVYKKKKNIIQNLKKQWNTAKASKLRNTAIDNERKKTPSLEKKE